MDTVLDTNTLLNSHSPAQTHIIDTSCKGGTEIQKEGPTEENSNII